jgi:hypothetical protein
MSFFVFFKIFITMYFVEKICKYAWTLHTTFLIIWSFTCIKTNTTLVLKIKKKIIVHMYRVD